MKRVLQQSVQFARFGVAALACFFLASLPGEADTIYVASDRSGEITAIDSTTGNGNMFSSFSSSYIALDGSGNLYGSQGNQILKFDRSGNASLFGSLSTGVDFAGLAFDDNNNLYVAEWYNGGSIVKFDSSGNGSVYLSGLPEPISVAFDSSGNLYVANWYGGIQKFSASRQYLSTWGASLPNPYGMAFDSSGNLYVSLVNSGEIVKFGQDGNETIFASGLNYPEELAFDSSGNLIVANWNWTGGSIEEIDPSGRKSTLTLVDGPQGIALQIPEPVTWAIVVLGSGALLGTRRLGGLQHRRSLACILVAKNRWPTRAPLACGQPLWLFRYANNLACISKWFRVISVYPEKARSDFTPKFRKAKS